MAETILNERMLTEYELQMMDLDIPGGYHRCSTTDGFKFQFVSDSFLEIVGWTRKEIAEELNNEFINVVAPEDRDYFMSKEKQLSSTGRIDVTYRIRRKDGTRRWVQDATVLTEYYGEKFYQCTLADITDYVEKVEAEKKRAEVSNLAKSTFLYNASHDIRTPLNAIQGFTRIIEENMDNAEMVKETLGKISKSSDMLMSLVNDILEITRIEREKEEVEVQPVNMEAHVQKLFEMFASSMEETGLNFSVENDIAHPNVYADDIKLTRIAMNLLSNARKFTPKGGEVTVGVKESNYDGKTATYTLYVRDTGIGMSQKLTEKAFDLVETERANAESGILGTGFGLALIKRLSDLMGGECLIESELGKGSTFTVSIPLRINYNEMEEDEPVVNSEEFEGKRVLVVEDNEFNREIACYTLEQAHFIVEEAENGLECVNKLMNAEPGYYDIVLMDIQMPVMDGYTATKEIRNIENLDVAGIPIIAMTANAFEEEREKCIYAGMNGHVGKPLDVEQLLEELRKFCCY